jgi:hypothetical protein
MMKHFRISYSGQMERQLKQLNKHLIKTILWTLIQNHEEQAQINHGQNLNRLNERHGLGLTELYAIINNIKFREVQLNEYECYLWLENLLQKCNS